MLLKEKKACLRSRETASGYKGRVQVHSAVFLDLKSASFSLKI